MYNSNVTVNISSTTNTTYHATLVIATQNINTAKGGSYVATVYGDEDNKLTNIIQVHYSSGSNIFSIYISLSALSKNLLHIQAAGLAGEPTNIATLIDTIPTVADGDKITIVNANAVAWCIVIFQLSYHLILHINIRSHYSRLETPFFTLLFVDRTHTETCCHFSVGSSFYFVSIFCLSISVTSVIEARRANILSIAA